MHINNGAGLGQKLFASSLALFVALSISPYAVLAADLGSSAQTSTAPASGVIRVGGQVMAIRAGQQITDAQRVALMQVLSAGRQALILNSLGVATGGRFDVGSVSNVLNIPQGVTALQNVANTGALNLTGNLNNAGNFFLYSTNTNTTLASISAANIVNNAGAMLSTVLPASLSLSGAISRLDLGLSATGSIFNAGTISSSGNLALGALGAITNSGTVQAANNLDISSNNITNSGLMSATAGNINFNAPTANAIDINNTGGTIQALLGDINVREAGYSAKSNFTLTGGNIFGKTFNLNGGSGISNVNVNTFTPVLNVNAGEAHVVAATDVLKLGEFHITGDPNIYNTKGDVLLTASITTLGANLAIVASRDIIQNAPMPTDSKTGLINGDKTIDISTTPTTVGQNGGTLTLIAGANFTTNASGTSAPPPGDNSTLVIKGGSATGGKIDLNVFHTVGNAQFFQTLGTFSTAGNGAGSSGGDVNIIAYKGSGQNSGTVNLPFQATKPLNTQGGTGGTNGNVQIIAGGGQTIRAILMGGITANGAGTTGGGNVGIYAATPTITGVNKTVTITDGAIQAGDGFAPGALTGSEIFAYNTINIKGDLAVKGSGYVTLGHQPFTGDLGSTINAGGNIALDGFILTNNGVSTTAGGSVTLTGAQTATTAITAGGDVNITANNGTGITVFDITTPGKITLTTTANNAGISINGNLSAGGDVTATANGTGQIFGGNRQIAYTGQSGSGWAALSPTAQFLLGATVSKDGTRIYQPDFSLNRVYILNAVTGAQVASLVLPATATGPQGTALSPDGTKLYVVTAGGTSNTPKLVVIDTSTNPPTVAQTFDLGGVAGLDHAESIAITPDGSKAFIVTDQYNGSSALPPVAAKPLKVLAVDLVAGLPTTQNTVSGLTATATSQTGGIVITPDGKTAYVTASGTKQVIAIDTTGNSVKSTIDMSYLNKISPQLTPYAVAMDPTGTRLYVGVAGIFREDTNGTGVFDGAHQDPITHQNLPADRQFVRDGQIAVIDIANNSNNFEKVLSTVKLPTAAAGPLAGGTFPQGLAMNPTGTQLYVQATYLPYVFDFYTGVNQTVENINVGPNNGPDGFGSTGWSSLLHVTNTNGNIPVVRTYASNTQNLLSANTVSVLQQGTIFSKTGNITLTSGGGNIIANVAMGTTNTNQIKINTGGTGAVLVSNLSDGVANIGASSAKGNIFEIGSINGLNINGDITAPRINIRTAGPQVTSGTPTAPDINLNANIGGKGTTLIEIKAQGAGSVFQAAGKTVTGTFVSLFSNGGTLGASPANALHTVAANLSASTAGTDVNLVNTGAVKLSGSASGGNFNLTNSAGITVQGSGVVAPNVSLTTGTKGALVLSGIVGSALNPGTISLVADTTGAITQTKGTSYVAGKSITLTSGTGAMGTLAAPIRLYGYDTNAANNAVLTATTTGSAYFTDSGPSALELRDVAVGPTLNVKTTAADVVVNNTLPTAMQSKSITIDSGKSITLNSSIGAPSVSTVSLTARGSGGSILANAATINGASVVLAAPNGASKIGDSGNSLVVTAPTVTINGGTGATVDVLGVGLATATKGYAMTLKGASGDTVHVVSDGSMVVSGAVNAPNVSLETVNKNSPVAALRDGSRDLTIGANIGNGAGNSSSVFLHATNSGLAGVAGTTNIIEKTGTVTGNTLTLKIDGLTDTGAIGSLTKPILTKGAGADIYVVANPTSAGAFMKHTGNAELMQVATNGQFRLTTVKDTKVIADTGRISINSNINTFSSMYLQATSPEGEIYLNNDVHVGSEFSAIAGSKGIILLGGDLSANGTVTLTAPLGISQISASPRIFNSPTEKVNITTGVGNLGSLAQPVQVDGGIVNIKSTATGMFVKLMSNSASLGTISDTTKNAALIVTTDTNNGVTLNGPINVAQVGITSEKGIVSANDPKFTVGNGIVLLTAKDGNIGGANPVFTKAKTLQLSAPLGSVSVYNNGIVTLEDSVAQGGFTFGNVGNATVKNITGTVVDLSTTGGSITRAGGTITGSTSVSFNSLKTLGGPTTPLTAGSFGTATSAMLIDTPLFSANTNGKVYTVKSNALTDLHIGPSSAAAFAVQSAGNMLIDGAVISAAPTLTAIGTGSTITLGADVGTAKGTSTIIADGDVLDGGNNGTVSGTNVLLQSRTGSLGTNVVGGVNVNATNLTLGFAQGANSFVKNAGTGALTFKGVIGVGNPAVLPTANQFFLSSVGNVTFANAVAATSVVVNGSGSITANAKNVAFLTPNSTFSGAGDVKVNLLTPAASTSSTYATSSGGSIALNNSGGTGLSVGGIARKSFAVTDNSGSLTVASFITTGDFNADVVNGKATTNGISLIETGAGGKITVADNVSANGGSIIMNVPNATGASDITINGTKLVTTIVNKATAVTNGNVTIALGKLPTTGTNVITGSIAGGNSTSTTAPGKVFGGVNPGAIDSTGGGSVNAAGRSVIFNAPVGAIHLNDSNVTADPPGMGTQSAAAATVGGAVAKASAPTIVMPVDGVSPAAATANTSNIVNLNTGSVLVPTNINTTTATVNPFKPIAFISGSATAFARAAETRGLSLYAPREDAKIQTAIGTLNVKAGAAVLAVMQPNGTVSIFNLHDNGSGDVSLEAGGTTTTLHPGEHVTVAAGAGADFSDVNPVECISHRDVRTVAAKDGNATIYTSEFSIMSALKGLPSLMEMCNSKNGAERKVASGIMKTAASLMQLSGGKAPYQRFASQKSRMTAMQ